MKRNIPIVWKAMNSMLEKYYNNNANKTFTNYYLQCIIDECIYISIKIRGNSNENINNCNRFKL